MLKKRLLFFFPILVSISSGYSQNLIANSSFEDINICYERNKDCSPSAWWNIRATSMRYFKGKGHTGRTFIKQCEETNHRTAGRDYMQAPLLCPLVKGKRYVFSMYVGSQHSDFIMPQVYFSSSFLCSYETFPVSMLKYSPDIVFYLNKRHRRKATKSWVKVENSFVASGNEKYIVIGNFSQDTTSYFEKYPGFGMTSTNIDDVSLEPMDHEGYVYCDLKRNKDSIYDLSFRHSCPDEIPEFFSPPKTIQSKTEIIHYTLGDVNFEFDRADLNPSADSVLKTILVKMKNDADLKMKIQGYTDSLGSVQYNIILSGKRAKSVGDFFMGNYIEGDRMTLRGYGAANPLASNETEIGRSKNRRVEIYLWK